MKPGKLRARRPKQGQVLQFQRPIALVETTEDRLQLALDQAMGLALHDDALSQDFLQHVRAWIDRNGSLC